MYVYFRSDFVGRAKRKSDRVIFQHFNVFLQKNVYFFGNNYRVTVDSIKEVCPDNGIRLLKIYLIKLKLPDRKKNSLYNTKLRRIIKMYAIWPMSLIQRLFNHFNAFWSKFHFNCQINFSSSID